MEELVDEEDRGEQEMGKDADADTGDVLWWNIMMLVAH
jgi:hypothetical protein